MSPAVAWHVACLHLRTVPRWRQYVEHRHAPFRKHWRASVPEVGVMRRDVSVYVPITQKQVE